MGKHKKKTILTTKQKVQHQLWHRGELSWLLYDYQLPVYHAIRAAMFKGDLKFVLNIARRFGKSTILCLISLEEALRTQRSQIRYASPSGKELRKAILPIINNFLDTCPDELKPTFNTVDMAYKFPNRSQIHLSGVNQGHADDLRGSAAHLIVVDEAAQIDDLEYLVQSVLMPQTLTTDAITIMASTPAVSQDHDFYTYYLEAKLNNYLAEFDIYHNTSLSPKRIEQIKKDCGGENDTTWQREYLALWVQDAELDIIPEWTDKYIKKPNRADLFAYYHRYTSMDIGVVDKTAIIYGYYDFKRATLVIEHEDVMNGYDLTTDKIHKAVKKSEKMLWGSDDVYKRISDNNNLILLHDLSAMHDMYFLPTNKDNLDAMVNEVRMFIKQGRLEVSPACTQLIGCLKHGIWSTSKTRREFARSKTLGHMDALSALVYLIRNLNMQDNPVPANLGINTADYHVPKSTNTGTESEQINVLKKVFNRK